MTLSLTWAGRPAAAGLADAGSGAGRGQTPRAFRGGWPRWSFSRRPKRSALPNSVSVSTVSGDSTQRDGTTPDPGGGPPRSPKAEASNVRFPGHRPAASRRRARGAAARFSWRPRARPFPSPQAAASSPAFPIQRSNRSNQLPPPARRAGASAFQARRWPSPFGATAKRRGFHPPGGTSFFPPARGGVRVFQAGASIHPAGTITPPGSGRGPKARASASVSLCCHSIESGVVLSLCCGCAAITVTGL